MLLVKLVSSERCHTRFDSSGAEGDENQTQHGQSSAEQRKPQSLPVEVETHGGLSHTTIKNQKHKLHYIFMKKNVLSVSLDY